MEGGCSINQQSQWDHHYMGGEREGKILGRQKKNLRIIKHQQLEKKVEGKSMRMLNSHRQLGNNAKKSLLIIRIIYIYICRDNF